MDYIAWAIMVVWFFLLTAGHVWKETWFKVGGGVIGLVLMIEIIGDSFLFALGLLLLNAYIIWTAIMSEL